MPLGKLPRWKKWPDLSLRTKCLVLISFPAAATVLMFGVANILAERNAAGVELVDRARETAEEIQRLRLADLETTAEARAYIITAQESFASQARASLAAFESSQHKLLNLTADSAVQQQRLWQVAALEHARVERMFGDFARFRSGALPWDQFRGAVSQVEAERRQKEDLLQLMERDNARQLDLFRGKVARFGAEQGAITGICLFFGLLGGAATTLLFARGITSRIAHLQRNVAQLASGAAPSQLAGQDEIGALNAGLMGVAETLRRKGVVLENALHGIAEIDPAGRYLWLNRTYAEMAGCSQSRKPAHIAATVQEDDRPRVTAAIALMRMNGRAEIAARMESSHGAGADVGMTFLAASEDPASSFYIFLRDIWAGKRGDAALIRAKDAAEASQPRQVRIPGQDQPRYPHTAQRHPGRGGPAFANSTQHRSKRICEHVPAQLPPAGGPDQRLSGFLPHRSGSAARRTERPSAFARRWTMQWPRSATQPREKVSRWEWKSIQRRPRGRWAIPCESSR